MNRAFAHVLLPPVRRVLSIDAGGRRLKMLLAESDFGRFRILKEELIDLNREGLVSPEEVQAHIHASLESWGDPPVALVLPEHLSISQVIDVPRGPDSEVDKLIAEETVKLSGVTESHVVYDFYGLDTAANGKQKFWVTLCQENDIRERILRLGLAREDLCEATTTANALISAYRAAEPLVSRAILVHFGAQSSVVCILVAGRPAFASSFPMGGDFVARALARERHLSEEAAEALKHQQNFLTGSETSGAVFEAVNGWVAELKRQLNEWFQDNPQLAAEVRTFALVASGGGFEQLGLLEYLRADAALDFMRWPKPEKADGSAPSEGFEVAYGAALQSLGYTDEVVSLLPEDYTSAWQARLSRQRIEMVSFVLLGFCVLLLALGTWRKLSLYTQKNELFQKIQAAQSAVEANDALVSDLVADYENLRPILSSEQQTLDTLKSLALIEQSCARSNFWYVLVADQQSYFSRPAAAVLATNRPAKTNLLGPSLESLRPVPIVPRYSGFLSNFTPAKAGLIAELCIPGDADSSRQLLSDLVNGWKQQPMFSKVDLLSEDLRRNLADPKVIVPERDYVLALDFAETDFQQAVRLKHPTTQTRPASKRRKTSTATPSQDLSAPVSSEPSS